MRNGLWTKGFVLGIIFFSLGASVLPSVSGNAVNVNSADVYKTVAIGLIKNMEKINDNFYLFNCVLVFGAEFVNGKLDIFGIFHNNEFLPLEFESKFGFISNHFICGVFTIGTIP